MTTPVEVEAASRNILIPLFQNCQYDRVLIDSVLEGRFGKAHADSAHQPAVARLDSGAFTLLGGNPRATGVRDLLRLAPIAYVTPQTEDWRRALVEEFGAGVTVLPFTDFSPAALDPTHLARLIKTVPPSFELGRIDKSLAEQLPSDLGNAYFLENFYSVEDFLGRGIGYCLVHQNKIVSAATSMAQSRKAIDIEIETAPGFRRQGLATVVGARLIVHCLEQEIEPRWLAANAASERLAVKLGYIRRETYETLAIQA